LLAPDGKDEINIKKAEPRTNCFIAPPVYWDALCQIDFENPIKEANVLKQYW
jgi:hypothetical protein